MEEQKYKRNDHQKKKSAANKIAGKNTEGQKQTAGKNAGRKWKQDASNQSWKKTENQNPRSRGIMKDTDKDGNHKKDPKKSKCPIFDKCGGCQHLDTDYEEQLKMKQKTLKKLLGEYGQIEPIVGMKTPLYYRNKVHAVLKRKKDGTVIPGVYEADSRNVLPVSNCFIENQQAAAIIADIAKLLQSFKIKIYNADTDFGLVRDVIVRVGYYSKQVMVVIVTTSPIFPSKNNFVKVLLKEHPEITTVIQNINDRQTSFVLGKRDQVLYGKGFIEDSLCGKTFRISAQSFYQINSEQTEILYKKAIKMAELKDTDTVIDAYCGIGTIGIIASDKAKEVIGVELNSDAVKDARINAKRNEVKNITFYNNDAGRFITELAEQGKSADVVFLDPPRSGSDETFLSTVLRLAPEKIVYISCGPESLARDLEFLTKGKKYRVKKMGAVDMFPHTGHVETVCCLQRVNM